MSSSFLNEFQQVKEIKRNDLRTFLALKQYNSPKWYPSIDKDRIRDMLRELNLRQKIFTAIQEIKIESYSIRLILYSSF